MNKKIYLLFALIVVTISVKAQEPQCESFQVTESRCAFSVTPTTLNAVFNNTNFQTTDSYRLSSSVPCPPPDEDTPQVGVEIDDGYSQIINLGFNFCYYGNTYDQIVVNDNGFITFDLSVADSHDFNTYTIPEGINTTTPTGTAVLPTPQEQTNAIYACWVDTYTPNAPNPATAIQFRLVNQDNPGKRVFIIDWKHIPLFIGTGEFLSASLHLYETSNVIETNIYEIGESSTNSGRAVVGLQNKSGTLGWSVSDRTNGNWTATNPWVAEKWVMIPDGNVLGYEFKWYADYGQGNGYEELFPNLDLDPLSVEVNPDTETNYKAELKFQSECSFEQMLFEETVIIDPLNQDENVQNPVDLYLCETSFGDGTANFDIDQFDTLLAEYIASATWDMNDFTVSYYASVDDRDNDNNPIDSSTDYNAADNTTIYVRITFDYETECLDDSEFVLHVTPLPDTTFNYDQSIYCIVDNDPTPTAITPDGEYTIDNGGVIDSVTGEIDIAGSGAGNDGTGIFNITYTITVSTYDNNNLLTECTDSSEVTVSLEVIGAADFTYPATVCIFDNNPAPIQFIPGGTFTINNGGVIDSLTGEIDLTSTSVGVYEIVHEMYANTNCPSSSTQNITIYAEDDASFTYPLSIYCNDGLNPLPTSVTQGGEYTINNGGVIVDADTGEIDLIASGLGIDNTGVFVITYTTLGNCSNSTDETITIEITEDASFSFSSSICLGDSNPVPLSIATNGGTFSINNSGSIDSVTGEIDLANTPAGVYEITYNLNTNGNCPSSSTQNITIYAEDDASFTYPNAMYCNDDINPLPTAVTFGGTYSINNGGVLIDASTGEVDLVTSALGTDGTGNFEVSYTTSGNCSNTSTFPLSIVIREDASFSFSTDVCSYDANPQAFDVATTGGTFSVNNGASINNNGVLDLTTTTPGTTYEITYGFTGFCASSSSQSIIVHESPLANTPTTILNECNNGDGTANFNLSSLEDEIIGNQNVLLSYHPTYQDAEDNTNMINIIPFARVDDNVFARVENTNGCVSIVQVPLSIENCYIVLPSGFSPNSSITNNQTFDVRNLRVKFPKFQLFIYNRYGNLVYEGDATSENWNGKLNNEGDLLPAGTYFYGIKLNDEQELTNRGWVYLQQ